jgi:hypothetical protein
MAITIGGIVCQELVRPGGQDYRENYSIQGGPTCTKSFLCPWANRYTVAHAILGLNTVTSILGAGLTLVTPMPFPELSLESGNSLASMYAREVAIKGYGNPTQGTYQAVWPQAEVIVTYGPFPWTFGGIDNFQISFNNPYLWAVQNITFNNEFITIPGRSVQFLSTGTPLLGTDWGFNSPKIDFEIVLKNVPYLPTTQLLAAMVAPVNSLTYLGINPGYLLFNGPDTQNVQLADGTQGRDIGLSFSYRPIAPWDYTFNPKRTFSATYGWWDQVVGPDGSTPVIARSDLSQIVPSAYQA